MSNGASLNIGGLGFMSYGASLDSEDAPRPQGLGFLCYGASPNVEGLGFVINGVSLSI